jgi:hypothetical protein
MGFCGAGIMGLFARVRGHEPVLCDALFSGKSARYCWPKAIKVPPTHHYYYLLLAVKRPPRTKVPYQANEMERQSLALKEPRDSRASSSDLLS